MQHSCFVKVSPPHKIVLKKVPKMQKLHKTYEKNYAKITQKLLADSY